MAASDSSDPGPSEDHLTDRLLVDRYRLNTRIASGGMAEVWEATDETLARRVAVKLLHTHLATDDSFVQRFRAEAVAAARLAHPSIVSVYDTFSVDGLEAIVMELVVGTTVRADLDAHGPMRLDAALAIGTQVADALGTAHAAGLVHRDVKPANILLAADGRVLVADFGIAKAAEGNDLTSAGAMIGTAKYLAPEQVEGGSIDGRADLYALGVVLYEALTGVPPFAAETDAATALARLHRDPTPPRQIRPDIPPAVEAVILQAMAKDRSDRFATSAAMRTALANAGAAARRTPPPAPVSAPRAPVPPAAPPPAPVYQPPPPAPAPQQQPPLPQPTEGRAPRSRAPLVAAVLVLAAVAAAWFAFSASDSGGGGASAIDVVGIRSFDPPPGDGVEGDDRLLLALDGSADTAWQSERYGDPQAMAGKDGAGFVLELDATHDIDRVELDSPEGGWSAEVYVVGGDAPAELVGWGAPAGTVESAGAGTTTVDTGGQAGDQVLVWFTSTAPSGRVSISGATVDGR